MPRRVDAVEVAVRESTRLVREPRQSRDGIVPHRKEFDTTLKVRLDTLRAELTREKDAAILSLKQAQDSQLEELKEYYTSRYASKVSEMQKLIDAKDAKIEELEAALGDPLSLWWRPVRKSNFYGAFGDACSMAWRCRFLTARRRARCTG